MKHVHTCTLAGVAFTIEDDAYDALKTYIKSIEDAFGTYPDALDIVKEIEARIAEILTERVASGEMIRMIDVEHVKTVMGRADDLNASTSSDAGSESHTAYTKTNEPVRRKLYRDTDNVVLFGVCSGLAAYFKLDPVVIRIATIILTIMSSGFGIVVYIIMILMVPKAKTQAEKARMHGGTVDLAWFKTAITNHLETLKNGRSKK